MNKRKLQKKKDKVDLKNSSLNNIQVNLKKESLHLSVSEEHNHTHNVTVSDLPSPEIFEAYSEKMQSLILERIKADIDNDKELISLEKREQSIRITESNGELMLRSRGQVFAFISLLLLLSSSIHFANIEAYKIAGSIVTVTIVGAITAFSGFNSMRKKKEDKEKKK